MEYRTLPHGGEKISVIGLGAGSLHNSSTAEIERTVRAAMEAGVNYMDFIPSEASAFEGIARALRGQRDRMMLQVHLGADYSRGAYGWTTDAKTAIREFEERLRTLDTDYADFGFIHCIDEDADFDKVMNGGIWDYACRRKQEGVIRHLGFSTHSVHIARRFLATGAMDMGMFSMNPMYDFTDESAYGKGSADDRASLYKEFERAGVGISVMKTFAGGQLLDAVASPFHAPLTPVQCLQYVLDKPGVIVALPGVRNEADLADMLAWVDATPEQRSYAVIGQFAPPEAEGVCVYCNHCQPCPEGIAIGLANKYYDLARLGDAMAADHYRTLERHASDCTHCGHCNRRCPFGVNQSARMTEIAAYFGV
ncbi:aldo/keto reductase [Adlercreutzia sp. R25]|uniref:aldo/keto reductase n=1 Tax=Adlercreutzia shanghongiae TaxID=3111773 RepID=UPI002DBF8017|nr:aldo/keto reductase [Adlercreutzia sp. R25]MEC4271889.1 aldo/keto reductase [Adlercreutzia sp. R25]